MSGYYPDGVTGNEYAIAGSDREWSDERTVYCQNYNCDIYDEEQEAVVELSSYKNEEWGTWVCSSCEDENVYEREIL